MKNRTAAIAAQVEVTGIMPELYPHIDTAEMLVVYGEGGKPELDEDSNVVTEPRYRAFDSVCPTLMILDEKTKKRVFSDRECHRLGVPLRLYWQIDLADTFTVKGEEIQRYVRSDVFDPSEKILDQKLCFHIDASDPMIKNDRSLTASEIRLQQAEDNLAEVRGFHEAAGVY